MLTWLARYYFRAINPSWNILPINWIPFLTDHFICLIISSTWNKLDTTGRLHQGSVPAQQLFIDCAMKDQDWGLQFSSSCWGWPAEQAEGYWEHAEELPTAGHDVFPRLITSATTSISCTGLEKKDGSFPRRSSRSYLSISTQASVLLQGAVSPCNEEAALWQEWGQAVAAISLHKANTKYISCISLEGTGGIIWMQYSWD